MTLLHTHFSGNDSNLNRVTYSLWFVVEGQQPLHLFLSSSNSKSLNDAKRLAENLLDTISVECGVSRYSTSQPLCWCKMFLQCLC